MRSDRRNDASCVSGSVYAVLVPSQKDAIENASLSTTTAYGNAPNIEYDYRNAVASLCFLFVFSFMHCRSGAVVFYISLSQSSHRTSWPRVPRVGAATKNKPGEPVTSERKG